MDNSGFIIAVSLLALLAGLVVTIVWVLLPFILVAKLNTIISELRQLHPGGRPPPPVLPAPAPILPFTPIKPPEPSPWEKAVAQSNNL